MASYRLVIKASAKKELLRLGTEADRRRISAAIQGLIYQPRPVGGEKIAGSDRAFRIRIGHYRVVYEIMDDVLVVYVFRVAHRRDVYK